MRLQRVKSRGVGRRAYYKYQVVVPEAVVRTLGWQPGGEVAVEVRGTEVVLSYMAGTKARAGADLNQGSDYETFRDRIRAELVRHPEGRTWTQIKGSLRLPQKVPNNGWVRALEKDIGLLRLKSAGGTLWKLK